MNFHSNINRNDDITSQSVFDYISLLDAFYKDKLPLNKEYKKEWRRKFEKAIEKGIDRKELNSYLDLYSKDELYILWKKFKKLNE